MIEHPSPAVASLHGMAEGGGGVVAVVFGERRPRAHPGNGAHPDPRLRSGHIAQTESGFYAGLRRPPAATLLEACLTLADARRYEEVLLVAGRGDHLPHRPLSALVSLGEGRTICYLKRPVADAPKPAGNAPERGPSRFASLRRPEERRAHTPIAVEASNMNWRLRLTEMYRQIEQACGVDHLGNPAASAAARVRRLIVVDAEYLLPDKALWHKELAQSHAEGGSIPARFARLQKIMRGRASDLLLLARNETEAMSFQNGTFIYSQIEDTENHAEFRLQWPGAPVWRLPDDRLTPSFAEFYQQRRPLAYEHFQYAAPSKPSINRPLALEAFTKEELLRRLISGVVGQDEAMRVIAETMVNNLHNRAEDDNRPLARFLLPGPTGSGKTETAKALARALFGRLNDQFVEIQGGDALKMSAEPLLGLQPGYVGYTPDMQARGGGLLTRPLILNPGAPLVILIDELSRAHPETPDKLFTALDEGHARDTSSGHVVSFRNTIFLFTTNDAAHQLLALADAGEPWRGLARQAPDLLYSSNETVWQRPFLARFDAILPLCYPPRDGLVRIARGHAIELIERHQRAASVDEGFLEEVVDGYQRAQGVRELLRMIDQRLLGQLSALRQAGKSHLLLALHRNGELVEVKEP